MEGPARGMANDLAGYTTFLGGEREAGEVRRPKVILCGRGHVEAKQPHVELRVAPAKRVAFGARDAVFPWPHEEEHGDVAHPGQAIGLGRVDAPLFCKDVVDETNRDGLDPRGRGILAFVAPKLPLDAEVDAAIGIYTGVPKAQSGECLPNRPDVRLCST